MQLDEMEKAFPPTHQPVCDPCREQRHRELTQVFGQLPPREEIVLVEDEVYPGMVRYVRRNPDGRLGAVED